MTRKDTGNVKTDCSFKEGNCKGYKREKKWGFSILFILKVFTVIKKA